MPPPSTTNVVKLSATDVLAPTTMKNAAKCDTSCDLQNPVNHQNFERILRFRDMPGSMLVGVSVDTTRPSRGGGGLCVFRSASSECTEALERPTDYYYSSRTLCLFASRCRGGAFVHFEGPSAHRVVDGASPRRYDSRLGTCVLGGVVRSLPTNDTRRAQGGAFRPR